MGDLIVMSRPQPLPAREFIAGHSAAIMFFTGVRYYRMDEAAEPAKLVGGKLAGAKRRHSPERRTAKQLREKRLLEALA